MFAALSPIGVKKTSAYGTLKPITAVSFLLMLQVGQGFCKVGHSGSKPLNHFSFPRFFSKGFGIFANLFSFAFLSTCASLFTFFGVLFINEAGHSLVQGSFIWKDEFGRDMAEAAWS
jgi:hypothetical protein